MHPELPVGAFLASLLVLVPLPWHWRARNAPTLSMMTWLFVSNMTYAINSIIWAGSLDEVVPVWCDITTKIDVGATAALPASCLSLALQLWRVACAPHTTNKRSAFILDIVLCWGFPAIIMVLHYTFQGHRFDIIEDFGCRPTSYVSVPAILLFYAPIASVVLLTFIFSGLAFTAFYKRRRTFTSFLQTTKSALTARRYVRLMAITTTLAVWDAAVLCLVSALTFRTGLRPYTSWADVHSDFSRVDRYPTVFMPPALLFWTYVSWWTIPLSGLTFFCAFGLGEDAAKQYGPWFSRVAAPVARIGLRRRARSKPAVSGASSNSSEAHIVLRKGEVDSVIDIGPDFSYDTSERFSESKDAEDSFTLQQHL
ncbi:putative fungal pheromone GPCR, STE3-type [Mycena belliarum]|uniref:Fungal pheromone GPCR, STE3-type n=1 Tax=Mycena belliarum TaxID=1033014 RepID=A0AAD6U3Z9_9AGAR|nr:putative fungal pheromone GPCR, STE3-type [Mycena belliae]